MPSSSGARACPVTLENDINLAALGEQSRGVARGVDDFVFLSVGTGLGAGVVLHGELHRGHHGAAGEVDYALGSGTRARHGSGAPRRSRLRRAAGGRGRARDRALGASFDVPAIFGAARAGDALAREVVDEEARRIARTSRRSRRSIDVELVVIGGGIGANGDLLLAPIRELVSRATSPTRPASRSRASATPPCSTARWPSGAPRRSTACSRTAPTPDPAHRSTPVSEPSRSHLYGDR